MQPIFLCFSVYCISTLLNYKLCESMKYLLALLLPFALLMSACGGGNGSDANYTTDQTDPTEGDWVVVHELSDPEDMNPLTGSDASNTYINNNMFYRLLEYDPETHEIRPMLAKSRPEISEDGRTMQWEIHPDAVWDNGEPITGHDVKFSLKIVNNPNVDCQHLRPYLNYVKDVIVDKENPKQFTATTNMPYMFAETGIGMDLWIMPKYFYDPEGLLDEVSLPELSQNPDQFADDPQLKAFADGFNSSENRRDPKRFSSSGPYKFESWETGQKLVLVKKDNHWTDRAKPEYLRAYPAKIIYKINKDPNSAIVELKKQKIDVMRSIPARDFKKELLGNERIEAHYALSTPDVYAFSMIALNNRPPRKRAPYFEDKRVRRAMAHLFDAEKYIKNIVYGYGTPIVGPVSPLDKTTYNDKLKPIEFSPEKAKTLLEEAGWKDTDKNGVLDKMVNGKRVEFKPQFMINQGNKARESLAQMMASEAEKVGIQIEIISLGWSTLIERMDQHDYDMTIMGWITNPGGSDPSQLWHSNQINSGSNYLGYSNPEVDRLTDEIRRTVDKGKRDVLYQRLQEILYEDQPCVFTTAPKNRLAVHKRFKNVTPTAVRPGYSESRFWTPTKYVKYP